MSKHPSNAQQIVEIFALPIWVLIMSLGVSLLESRSLVFAQGEELQQPTDELIKSAVQYQRASASGKRGMVQALTQLAQARKALLLKQLPGHPETVLRYALPEAVANSLPEPLPTLVEQPLTIEGEYTSLQADDFEHGASELIHELKVSGVSPTTYRLYFAHQPPTLPSGTSVRAHGIALDHHLMLEEGAGASLQTTSTTSTTSTVSGGTVVSGDQPSVVFLLNFQDAGVTCSASSVASMLFGSTGSVDQLYREMTFGKVTVSGTVIGPYTIPYTSAGACDYNAWSAAGDSAATAAGVNLSPYTHRIYVVPRDANCTYAGYGTYGGSPARVWNLGYCSTSDLYAHEIGHNLNLRHASTPTGEYDDTSDVMGYSGIGLRHVNAPHKAQMGWVPSTNVQTVTTSGTYTVALSEAAGTQVQALRIAKPDTHDYYYAGYRHPVGFDTILAPVYADKINIHRWAETASNTYFLASLADGGLFNDTVNGVTIQQMSHDANGATLAVTLTAPPCTAAAPLLSVSPMSQSAGAGKSLAYTVTITNKDGSTCSTATMALASVVPSGWSSNFSPASLTLSPGTSGSSTWTVASSPTATDGSYAVTARTTDALTTAHTTSTAVTAIVFTDLTLPVVAITSPVNGSAISNRVPIAASATDNVGIAKVNFIIDGVLKATDTSAPYSYTWNAKQAARGTHTITVTALDTSNNSASATVMVTK